MGVRVDLFLNRLRAAEVPRPETAREMRATVGTNLQVKMAPKQELYSNAAPLVGKLHPFILAAFPPIGLPRTARPAARIVQLNKRARPRKRGGASQ